MINLTQSRKRSSYKAVVYEKSGFYKKENKTYFKVNKENKINCEIAPAEKADLPTIIELWKISNIRIEPEDSSERLSRFIKNDRSRCFKAVFQEKIVGAILCGSDGRYGYIHHIAVDDNFRKQGIGRALAEKCQDFFNEIGIDTKAVFVWDTNDTALKFWKSVGFNVVEGLRVLANLDKDDFGE